MQMIINSDLILPRNVENGNNFSNLGRFNHLVYVTGCYFPKKWLKNTCMFLIHINTGRIRTQYVRTRYEYMRAINVIGIQYIMYNEFANPCTQNE